MKLKNKKITMNKKVITISLCALFLVIVGGISYAYFAASVTGNEEAKDVQAYAGTMALKLDGTTIVSPSQNMLPGTSHTINFSVENTGSLTTTYELDMKEVYNDFATKSELVYSLKRNEEQILEEIEVPSIDAIILPAVVIDPEEIQNYELTINFKETGADQNYNQNKTFSGKVQISGIDSSNYLQAKVLARSINTTEPDFSTADPVTKVGESIRPNRNVSLPSNITGDKTVGTGYTFNEQKGLYTLTDVVENQTYDETTIGKYTCNTTYDSCQTMYKINEVETSSATQNYDEVIYTDQTVSYTSASDKVVGDAYYLDQASGNYVLQNVSELKSYGSEDIGKYTCNNDSTTCVEMYKINEVEDTTVTNVDDYDADINENIITNADYYISTTTKIKVSTSGLYKTEDDEGESYYFRGAIENNYVSFAGNLWRIVRINGDGSIRLIHATTIGNNKYNATQDPKDKSAGYTFDNESACTKESPCISEYDETTATFINNKNGTNSDMKTYLEDWYLNNLLTYDDKIALSSYCNDTTIIETNETGTYAYFGPYNRVLGSTPTLQCPDTEQTYGGKYKLKIGLLTTDEMNYGGLVYSSSILISQYSKLQADASNYLYYSTYWYSMSPLNYDLSKVYINTGYNGSINNYNYYIATTAARPVRPVINLKSDVLITQGDGTKNNPYVIAP